MRLNPVRTGENRTTNLLIYAHGNEKLQNINLIPCRIRRWNHVTELGGLSVVVVWNVTACLSVKQDGVHHTPLPLVRSQLQYLSFLTCISDRLYQPDLFFNAEGRVTRFLQNFGKYPSVYKHRFI
jgi:hypothetical protein